jgi:hypothetical protein
MTLDIFDLLILVGDMLPPRDPNDDDDDAAGGAPRRWPWLSRCWPAEALLFCRW